VRKKNAPWYGKAGENSTVWASPSAKRLVGGTAASAGRQGSVRAIASAWAALPCIGLMPRTRRPGRNVGARSRNTGRSRATFAARGGGL
jgi:hypothetical protein